MEGQEMSHCGNFAAQDGQVIRPLAFEGGVHILLSLCDKRQAKLNSKAP
jgi:hypothetical protein